MRVGVLCELLQHVDVRGCCCRAAGGVGIRVHVGWNFPPLNLGCAVVCARLRAIKGGMKELEVYVARAMTDVRNRRGWGVGARCCGRGVQAIGASSGSVAWKVRALALSACLALALSVLSRRQIKNKDQQVCNGERSRTGGG